MHIRSMMAIAVGAPILAACSSSSPDWPTTPGSYARIAGDQLEVLLIRPDGSRFEDTGTHTQLEICGSVNLVSARREAVIELKNPPAGCQLHSGIQLQVLTP